MIKVRREGIILEPTSREFENKSVLNPAVIQEGEKIHIIYRAIGRDLTSCLGYAKFDGPRKIEERWKKPYMVSKYKFEKKGIEDPRIVKIDDTYYLTYIVHDGKNALIAYSSGKNIYKLKRGGIISPQISYNKAGKLFKNSRLKDDYYFFESYYHEYSGNDVLVWNKDGFFFPQKFHGRFAFVHRILPDVQVAFTNDLKEFKDQNYWTDYISQLSKHVILEGKYGFEARHVGGGAPPIKTKKGWLFIYHTAEESNRGRIYHAGAALFDKKNPRRMIARLPYPLFSPEKDYEINGHVNRVVFPTGTAVIRNKLYIYYGAADSYIALASVDLNDLLDEITKYSRNHK